MSDSANTQQARSEQGVMMQRLGKYLDWITDEAADGISANIVFQTEDYPFLRLEFESFTAQLSYLHGDEDDENAPYGIATTVAAIDISPYNAARALLICDTFNAQSLGGFAYTSPEDNAIYYRMILQDADDADTAENFLYFLERYQAYFYVLRELCRLEEQETADESF